MIDIIFLFHAGQQTNSPAISRLQLSSQHLRRTPVNRRFSDVHRVRVQATHQYHASRGRREHVAIQAIPNRQ